MKPAQNTLCGIIGFVGSMHNAKIIPAEVNVIQKCHVTVRNKLANTRRNHDMRRQIFIAVSVTSKGCLERKC